MQSAGLPPSRAKCAAYLSRAVGLVWSIFFLSRCGEVDWRWRECEHKGEELSDRGPNSGNVSMIGNWII